MTKPDPRLNAYRKDLADMSLQNDVTADRYVEPKQGFIGVLRAPMLQQPENGAKAVSEAICGDVVAIYEDEDGWTWLQTAKDDYVGYVESKHVVSDGSYKPSHMISAAATLLFAEPDLKSTPVCRLFLNSQLAASNAVENQKWVEVTLPGDGSRASGYVYSKHLRPIDQPMTDPVSLATQFVGVPYLWGGGTADGLDCSGLIQQVLIACGYNCPRDSDMIESWLGSPQKPMPEKGDLVFWDGHVGMMASSDNIIHANAFHLSVKVEKFADVADRIAKEYGSEPRILTIKR